MMRKLACIALLVVSHCSVLDSIPLPPIPASLIVLSQKMGAACAQHTAHVAKLCFQWIQVAGPAAYDQIRIFLATQGPKVAAAVFKMLRAAGHPI